MMSSSRRTYGARKRKDPAEDKFEALFPNLHGKNKIVVEIGDMKKRRTCQVEYASHSKISHSPNTVVTCNIINGRDNGNDSLLTASPKRSPVKQISKHRETAAEKFDALFGKVSSKAPTSGDVLKMTQFSATDSDDEDNEQVEITRDMLPSGDHKSAVSGSKYEKLFIKNEKSASDKFDAVFKDEIDVRLRESPTENEGADVKQTRISQNDDFGDLFGFIDSENVDQSTTNSSSSSTFKSHTSTSNPVSPIKSPSAITRVRMKTVDGRVVLNIVKRTKKSSSDTSPEKQLKAFDLGLEKNKPLQSKHSSLTGNQQEHRQSVTNNLRPTYAKIHRFKDAKILSRTDDKLGSQPIKVFSIQNNDTVKIESAPKKPFHQSLRIKDVKKQPTSYAKISSAKASYNLRPWMRDCEDIVEVAKNPSSQSSLSQTVSEQGSVDSEVITPTLIRSVTWPSQVGESIVTSIKCNKAAKSYYTVVKHVKNYQNCLEEGEAKEFEDDVNYLIEGLPSSQPTSVRCLTLTNLANKCQQHAFRLYLRAHNVSSKVFSHLQDAKENKALALCSAALLFMLSRDRQIEINKLTVQLLLQLIDPFHKDVQEEGASDSDKQMKSKSAGTKFKFFKSRSQKSEESSDEKNNDAILSKIQDMVDSCNDPLLTGKDVSVKRLASEALLRFTMRRTSEWFREEIRLKGGLDHIISQVKINIEKLESISNSNDAVGNFAPERTLCTLERLLKVLENGIVNSSRNAVYLVTHQRALMLKKVARLMNLCKTWLVSYRWQPDKEENDDGSSSPYLTLYNTILQIIKLLVNISNDNEFVSSRVGDQPDMLESIVSCVLTTPSQLKPSDRYAVILLSLSLLVNLVESSAKNRIAIMKMSIGADLNILAESENNSILVIESLVKLFVERELAARDNEVLGEVGVKKAVEAKKGKQGSKELQTHSLVKSQQHLSGSEDGGHWVDTEEGMEWVPAESDTLPSSQESVRSNVSNRNPEIALTADEKTEMKETLDKANEHMEDSIVASYAALVLGCLIHGNRGNAAIIRRYLDDTTEFSPMVAMLKKFQGFMSLTNGMSRKGEKTLMQIIEDMEEENS